MSIVTSSTKNSSTNLLSGVKLQKSINDAGSVRRRRPWKSFRPSDTYSPNLSVDLHKHHKPKRWDEKFVLHLVQIIKIPTVFYSTRAMMLETVAAVPGMVGGMQLHLRSLRRFEQSGGWIKALLDEAENDSHGARSASMTRGTVENFPAPAISIDYWRLPKDARLRDVVAALRSDEAHDRDVNHDAADIRTEGKLLHDAPAPIDYH
ncbi:unnamed protein product [Calypogeia fissa]